MEDVKIKIKQYREQLKMTQKEFARYIGVTWRTVQNWEYGISKPKPAMLTYIELCIELHKV